jgi:hypothetical protein
MLKTIIEDKKSGKVLANSGSLIVFNQYERREGIRPSLIQLKKLRTAGELIVDYPNGATANVRFASYNVMCDWVRRKRNWRQVEKVEVVS